MQRKKGFTLIEILVVMTIIAMLAVIVIVAINPIRQFAQARNTQRWAAVNSLLNAVQQKMIDDRGIWATTTGCDDLPSTTTEIKKTGGVDICGCLVDTYVAALPIDPSSGTPAGGATEACSDSYEAGYTIYRKAGSFRIVVSAPDAELGETINVTR